MLQCEALMTPQSALQSRLSSFSFRHLLTAVTLLGTLAFSEETQTLCWSASNETFARQSSAPRTTGRIVLTIAARRPIIGECHNNVKSLIFLFRTDSHEHHVNVSLGSFSKMRTCAFRSVLDYVCPCLS